jgi:DNA-binding MarR family transcriptional regulator
MDENLRNQTSRLSNELRRAIEEEVAAEVRIAQNITDAIDQAVSEMFGVNRTDARCIDIIERHGRMTAGELAREAGLSTGAVTALLDRLERNRVVRRVPDTADRRKVLVELTPETTRRSWELFGPMADEASQLLGSYSDHDLRTILDFLKRGRQISSAHLERVRDQAVKVRLANAEARVTRAELKRVTKEVKAEVKATKARVKDQMKEPVKRTQRQIKDQLKRSVPGRKEPQG